MIVVILKKNKNSPELPVQSVRRRTKSSRWMRTSQTRYFIGPANSQPRFRRCVHRAARVVEGGILCREGEIKRRAQSVATAVQGSGLGYRLRWAAAEGGANG